MFISMQLEEILDDIAELELILEESVADALGVHPRDIELNVDPETGAVTYTISTDNE